MGNHNVILGIKKDLHSASSMEDGYAIKASGRPGYFGRRPWGGEDQRTAAAITRKPLRTYV